MIHLTSTAIKYQNHECFGLDEFILGDAEFCLLYGENGAGKTTFLKYLKSVLSNQSEVFFLSLKDFELIPFLTARENLIFYAQYLNPSHDLEKWYSHLKFSDQTAKTLSLGQQQWIKLLICCMSSAQLILLDEAFSYLDHQMMMEAQKCLRNFFDQRTVIIADQQRRSGFDRTFCIQNKKLTEVFSED